MYSHAIELLNKALKMDDFKEDWVCSACKQEFVYEDYEDQEFETNEFFQKYTIGFAQHVILCQRCAEDVARKVKAKKDLEKASLAYQNH